MRGNSPGPSPEQAGTRGQRRRSPLGHSLPAPLTSVAATSSKGLRGSIQGSMGPGW